MLSHFFRHVVFTVFRCNVSLVGETITDFDKVFFLACCLTDVLKMLEQNWVLGACPPETAPLQLSSVNTTVRVRKQYLPPACECRLTQLFLVLTLLFVYVLLIYLLCTEMIF